MNKNTDFSLPIVSPPWSKLGKKLESLVRKALFEFDLLENDNKIGIALSGGKDSLTMLYLLNAIKGRGCTPFDLYAFHVGGEFSCGASIMENSLKKICIEMNIPFFSAESTMTLEKLQCYRCSRERRKLIFDMAKAQGVTKIAFGHHRDDSIQTLLMNLLHKAEFAANLPKVPMEDYGITIIRPLIYMHEKDIESFAKSHGFKRVTCQCPVGQKSKRKDIQQIIEHLEEYFPNTRTNLAKAGIMYGSTKALKK